MNEIFVKLSKWGFENDEIPSNNIIDWNSTIIDNNNFMCDIVKKFSLVKESQTNVKTSYFIALFEEENVDLTFFCPKRSYDVAMSLFLLFWQDLRTSSSSLTSSYINLLLSESLNTRVNRRRAKLRSREFMGDECFYNRAHSKKKRKFW